MPMMEGIDEKEGRGRKSDDVSTKKQGITRGGL